MSDFEKLRRLNFEETLAKLKEHEKKTNLKQLLTGGRNFKDFALKTFPRLSELLGVRLAAEVVVKAKGLEKLARMPASKVQVLGAEKAMFRHLKDGCKAPKHGIIFSHPFVRNSENKGRAARKLALEIVKAARMDFFRKRETGEK